MNRSLFCEWKKKLCDKLNQCPYGHVVPHILFHLKHSCKIYCREILLNARCSLWPFQNEIPLVKICQNVDISVVKSIVVWIQSLKATLCSTSHCADIWNSSAGQQLSPTQLWSDMKWPLTPTPAGWSSTWELVAMLCTPAMTLQFLNCSRTWRGWGSSTQVRDGRTGFTTSVCLWQCIVISGWTAVWI